MYEFVLLIRKNAIHNVFPRYLLHFALQFALSCFVRYVPTMFKY